ncbi:unsaturated chondroitin disaccharide hydrolase [Catalinimonas alkaloidigena]|uniref:glycoside hydrolase family 88 protein n=1 Tax=Catalinimonas alkaloidigena TaxID=1075417 RepID=UPI0024059885|nr:glycoside hydrolase family 88 protein [Catalinimonas alkaloidigena]MDF9795891.1 unsaturated chondroitin disaccharide hydrolase [Catalinimonas alkaloidigena]
MLKINQQLKAEDLLPKIERLWELSAAKIQNIEDKYDKSKGSPVFTVKGRYTTRGWTEWTQGFQYGSAILQFDATGDQKFLKSGKENTVKLMAPHVSHIGVHDHGFNNVSTYGNLLRLMKEGKIAHNEWEQNFYELALKISGAVQATRWTPIKTGGFIHSFNGPHSLFVDTIRSCRSLMVGHQFGHVLQTENDVKINLLKRALMHIKATADYSVYYGEGRDSYDVRGRTAHEQIFNTKDGNYRCPNSQQGYTGFSTWTRGLAWAMCGFPEELEFVDTLSDEDLSAYGERDEIVGFMLKAAQAACDFFIENTPTDGIPYWDTGAPKLHKLGDYLNRPSDPYNDYEPIDSSAAAIGAQGLLRLGKYLMSKGKDEAGKKYYQAGLTVLDSLFEEPYISVDENHQGLLLHSIYHEPNGWDYVPEGSKIANGESSMWGDYHAREVALYVQRLAKNEPYYTFYRCGE